MLSDQGSGNEDRICTIRGPQVALTMAENLIQDIIQQQKNMESVTLTVPHWATGKIIGSYKERAFYIYLLILKFYLIRNRAGR